jgi:hypothetical protein
MSEQTPTPQQPPPPSPRMPLWWPVLTSVVGLGAFVYEVAFDKLDRPWIITGAIALALGGKVAEKVLR